MDEKKLLIIDGNSILNRAYYGIRPLTAPDGTPTNAVYGFLNIMLKYLDEETPDYLGVAFDLKAPTFRHKMYDGYKAQRKPPEPDFLAQLPLIKEVLGAMDCKCVELEGYEADDIIGTVSRICDEENIACSILTGDKDDLQLASNRTVIKLVVTRGGSTNTTLYDEAAVVEKYGVTPTEYIDVKALMGDPSDNIPGVKGVGEKTAFSLIQKYKSLDYIYENIDEIDVTNSVRTKLKNDKERAYLSKTLSTIVRDAPIDFELDEYKYKTPNGQKLKELFTRLNFKSFMKRFNFSPAAEKTPEVISAVSVEIEESEALGLIKKSGEMRFCLNHDIGRLTFSLGDGKKIYAFEPGAEALRDIFADKNIKKIGYDLKSDILYLNSRGIDFEGLGFDVLIAAYIDDPTRSKYDIDLLCLDYLGRRLGSDVGAAEGEQISMDADTGGDRRDAETLAAIIGLEKIFRGKLKKNEQESLYFDIELPLIKVLADMQITGMYVDRKELSDFGAKLKSRIEVLTKDIYEYAGEEFNIKSPFQLGDILFEKLALPHGKKTKRGYSTNIDVLKKLIGSHPIIEAVIEYRALTKLDSTYVDGLIGVINKKTGRIHSSFNQTVTATGRISSTEPNLQNIPVRTELGREIRKMFAAEGDRILVDADYSQIELRVLADISNDKNMCAAFLENDDIHTRTAAQVFKVPISEVTSTMRSRAKAVNFGIVYGIGAFSLAQDIKVSRKEADQYIHDYLNFYSGVDEYMKSIVEKAKADGYVTTKYNRRRYLPELKASNAVTRAFGERVARNAPIQGTAADIIKIAMVSVYRRLRDEGLKSKLILQVHDELIVEAVPEEREKVETILREEMQNAANLRVPLIVDLNSGKRWYDTK